MENTTVSAARASALCCLKKTFFFAVYCFCLCFSLSTLNLSVLCQIWVVCPSHLRPFVAFPHTDPTICCCSGNSARSIPWWRHCSRSCQLWLEGDNITSICKTVMLFYFKILLKSLCFCAAHINSDKRWDNRSSEKTSLSCWPILHFLVLSHLSVSSHLLYLVLCLDFNLFRAKVID